MTAPAISGAPMPGPNPRQPPPQYLASAGLEDTITGRASAPIRRRAVFLTIRSSSRWLCNAAHAGRFNMQLYRNESKARSIAGCFRFFTLIQCFCRPPRYGRSRCLGTRPSRPNSQALRNRSGPISPCPKSLRKMPSKPWYLGRAGRTRTWVVDRPIDSILRIWAESYTKGHELDGPELDLGRGDVGCRLEGVATIACLTRSDGRYRDAGPEATGSSRPGLSRRALRVPIAHHFARLLAPVGDAGRKSWPLLRHRRTWTNSSTAHRMKLHTSTKRRTRVPKGSNNMIGARQ
jgi:hypothetical protein